MEEFREKSRQWFDEIDFDLNDTISRREIRKESERLEPPVLRWNNVGFNEPDVGLEINNVSLSSVLMDGRIELYKQEFDIFNVSEMSDNSYIRPR